MTESRYQYHERSLELFDPLKERHPSWESEGERWTRTAKRGVKKYSVAGSFAVDLGRPLAKGYLWHTFEIVAREDQSAVLVIFSNFTWDGSTCSSDWRSMLASLVHDALCIAASDGYKMDYIWKQRIYRDILLRQGFPMGWANLRFAGLVAFNWF